MLIDVAQLHSNLNDSSWIVFDCRHDLFDAQKGARVYADGHIPGAFFAPVDTALSGAKSGKNGRHPLPAPEAFAAFLNTHGVTPETQIVTYDDVGGQYAARLWWLARWIGLTKVAVLNGGLPQWLARGYPVSKDIPLPRSLGSVAAKPDNSLLVGAQDVQAGIASGKVLVMDARSAERYRGETEPIDPVAGHIPTARNRFFKTNLNADLTMRPAEELRREFVAELGSRKPDEVVHQCGSGITACVNLLAMEHAGLTGSKLYVGSWSEWCADTTRPVAKGA